MDSYQSASMREETVIVTSTYHKCERYFEHLLPLLDQVWPNHPPVYFVTDRGSNLDQTVTFAFDSTKWVEVLLQGLLELTKRRPDLQYVLLLLDDHYPLRSCDTEYIEAVFKVIQTHKLHCVSFVTYDWPWNATDDQIYDGKVRTWHEIDTVEVSGHQFARVPTNFFRYFQLQPSFWQVNYLLAVCQEALNKGCYDAWSFEAFDYSKAQPHYISTYHWPSVHHGFLAQGAVNPIAIEYIQMPAGKHFRDVLLREYNGAPNLWLFRFYRFFETRILQRYEKLLYRYKKFH